MHIHALGDREAERSVSARAFAPFQLIRGAHDIDQSHVVPVQHDQSAHLHGSLSG
jgi:hypothetical protein